MGQEIVEIEQSVLWPVVLRDERSLPDAICVHSNDIEPKLIAEHAVEYYFSCNHRKVCYVVINGTTQEEWKEKQRVEFGGSQMWRELFARFGVPEKHILATDTAVHTGMEADEFVRIAKEQGWNSIAIVALPFHQLRCFLTMVTAMKKAQHYVGVYNLSVHGLVWHASAPRVVLGGSFEEGTNMNRILGEYDRIARYTKEGKCATLAEALAYLAKRGKR